MPIYGHEVLTLRIRGGKFREGSAMRSLPAPEFALRRTVR